ncbi:hypothetical protein [Escherichia coli]|uniref:hypothetical protein n=1 Tax=Escherichia coli TaxID=562 RepID=UPI001FF648B3|nr:hypothetical protein [Escherichia coli]
MSKFISVKVFRGTFPNEERLGQFAGQSGACFRVATDDEANVKCFHVAEPPFDVKDLDNVDHVRYFVFDSLVFDSSHKTSKNEVDLIGAELVAEYQMTEGENGGAEIERIK